MNNNIFNFISVSRDVGTYRKGEWLDLLQSLKQFFINVAYHLLVVSLTLMARASDERVKRALTRSFAVCIVHTLIMGEHSSPVDRVPQSP